MDWINDSRKWTENISSPSFSSQLEKDLLSAGGTDSQGRPNFRIVWGQDFSKARVWSRYEQDWFPRYWYRTIKEQKIIETEANLIAPVQFTFQKIGTPRFFIESRLDPEVAYASGTGKGIDSDGCIYGEAARDESSEWWTFIEVCHHDGECCALANEVNSTCHGKFELPGERQLQMVRAYRQWLSQQVGIDPRKPVTADFKANAFRQARDAERKQREMLEEQMEYASRHFLNTHIHRLSEDPSVLANGKYHFLGK